MFRWLVLSFILAVSQNTVNSQGFKEPIRDTRIVGGSPININQIPYQVSIQFLERHFCGGTLISEWFVISAAHCTFNKLVEDLAVRIGSSLHNYGGIVVPVARITDHPKYDDNLFDYDVTIIVLSTRQYYTRDFPNLPASLTAIEEGAEGIISGWGSSRVSGEFRVILRTAKVPLVNYERCNGMYYGFLTERMLCAGYPQNGGVDSCPGDGGGPLTVNGTLIGIVSWGKNCGEKGFPGVYTSVPSVVGWIIDVITLERYRV